MATRKSRLVIAFVLMLSLVSFFSIPASVFAEDLTPLGAPAEEQVLPAPLEEALDLEEEALPPEEALLNPDPDHLGTFSDGVIKASGFDTPSKSMMMRSFVSLEPIQSMSVDKQATQVVGTENMWSVTLTVSGINSSTTSDVVLVIDKSGSMGDGNKMANTKSAAKEFIDSLLKDDGLTRIAVVSFDENSHLISGFTNYVAKESLKDSIDGINANGGTNIQAGIHQAQILLDSSTATNQVMVILGDGEPTFSYKVTDATGISATTDPNHPNNHNKCIITYTNPTIVHVDYDEIVGSGGDYNLGEDDRYLLSHNSHTHKTSFPANNGVATIWEAGLAKDAGTEIYSIAINAGTNGESVLRGCASSNSNYYPLNSSDLTSLNSIFDQIAGQIVNAGHDAQVVDIMGPQFDLVSSQAEIICSTGTSVAVSPDNRTITWTIGDIVEGTPLSMTYTVKIKNGASIDPTKYPTNDSATLTYTVGNDRPTLMLFPVPLVSILNAYDVIFDSQGADNIGTTSVTGIASGNTVALPIPTPVKSGNSFGGWFTSPSGIGTEFTASTPVLGSLTVYAKWTPDTPETGSITVYKDEVGGSDSPKTFYFKYAPLNKTTVTNNVIEFPYEFCDANDGFYKLSNLAYGWYLVTEKADPAYTTSQSAFEVLVGANNPNPTVTFVNTLIPVTKYYPLTIHKLVDGTNADSTVFTFKVSLNIDGTPGVRSKTVTASAISPGVVMLPNGHYIVEELNNPLYTTAHTTLPAVVIANDPPAQVTFNNTLITDLGSLSIVKNVPQVENDTTGFTFIITGPEYSRTVIVSESSSFTINDLNPGEYTVVEQATPSYYTVEGSNTQIVTIGSGSFTNEQGIWNQTVTFTNNYSYTPPRQRDRDTIVIPEPEVPAGPVITPEVVLDEQVPAAPLPTTGGLDPGFLYGLGALLATGGLVLRKRKDK